MSNKVFSDYEHKFVKKTILYADADDGNVFYEKEHTTKVDKEDLFKFYLFGLVIVLDEEYLIPVAYKETGSYGTVTCVHDSAETATPVNFNSSEKTE